MSQPFPVEIISDEEEEDDRRNHHHHHRQHREEAFTFSTSPSLSSRKRRIAEDQLPNNVVVVLDDDPTPKKPNPPPPLSSSTPLSYVPETPMSSDPFKSDFSILKCSSRDKKVEPLHISAFDDDDQQKKFSGGSSLICLESDNDSEDGIQRTNLKENEYIAPDFGLDALLSQDFGDHAKRDVCFATGAISEVYSDNEDDDVRTDEIANAMMETPSPFELEEDQNNVGDEAKVKRRKTKEDKVRLAEEKRLKREQEKLQKKALKDEAAAAKKLQKEQQKWEKGKFALKSIVAEIDAKVVELGAIGGNLITRFADKGLSYRITSNPIERSILWKISVPEQLAELSSKETEIPYVLLVYEADEFCNLVISESLMDHVSGVQSLYSSYTICYLTNKLMAYINKREQAQYKNQSNTSFWRRPPVEEVFAKLTTDFARVHSRQCRDEFELADHVVGLTCALASCHYRKKLTRLSVNANGAIVPKDASDRNLIKKNIWLKALVAIPKVQPRFAIAIWKKYPTMKSLLSVYMDPSKSVHEKEFLLKDLLTEGLLGDDRRVGAVCSKRVYRILMAQNGNIKTDDVELGADFFRSQSLDDTSM